MLFGNCLFCTFCSQEKLPHRTVNSYPLLQKPKPSLSPADFRDTLILSSSVTGEWNPRLQMRKDSSTDIWNSRGWASVDSKVVEWASSSSSKGVFQLSKYDLETAMDDTTKRITEKVGWNTMSSDKAGNAAGPLQASPTTLSYCTWGAKEWLTVKKKN